MKIKYITTTLTLGLLLSQSLLADKVAPRSHRQDPVEGKKHQVDDNEQEKIQIALLLDTSSSMSGLIDQTRTQLWKVVNTFVEARRDGKAPYVEVALYEYGNSNLHIGNHYIRQIQPFTRDLDQLSSDLFKLTTSGGEEYCGAVIERSLSDLKWDSSDKTYKAIFVAGNEPFTQGPVDARAACKNAVMKSIVVNTIHCGDRNAGIAGSWHDGAALAEGKFMIIDQDRAVAHISAPQDKMISDLGVELNKTYIGYGHKRREAKMKQVSADQDAFKNESKGSNVGRAVAKASINYSNSHWDMVDAQRMKKIDLAKMSKDELPQEMQEMTLEERKDHVAKAARKREMIQAQILKLNKEREVYVSAERKKLAEGGAKTLDQVLIETARTQASALGYTFESTKN